MNRREMTAYLSALLEERLDPRNDQRVYWAKEVTFGYSADEATVRVDYMQFKPKNNTVSGIEKGDFYCFEIKSCVDDFHSPNGHNLIGDFNYYVMSELTYKAVQNEIPFRVGVMIPTTDWKGDAILSCAKKASRMDREKPVNEMLMMMYRSHGREVAKMRRLLGKEGVKT